MKYYGINEELARTAHGANHMRKYEHGETTARYRSYVDSAAEIAEERKKRYPDDAEHIDYLLDKYSRKLAEWYNKMSAADAMCPSVMISGAGNFPTHKKEKQNARRDALMQEWEDIQRIARRIETAGSDAIKSNDAQALEKLRMKLEKLEDAQEVMRETNAYYRKNKTLDGCPYLTESQIAHLKKSMAQQYHIGSSPFASWSLSNNSAEIRRIKDRIASLEKIKEAGTTEHSEADTGVDGLRIVENAEAVRLQMIFDGKPDEETRNILKKWGFKWAPSFGAWQRMLNANGRYAAEQVVKELKARDAE